MPELRFAVTTVSVDTRAVTPQLRFRLQVDVAGGGSIDTIVLQCQVMIEARRRAYADTERAGLLDLFGEPERWGSTLKTLLWTHVVTSVPAFEGSTIIDLVVPCSYDLALASAKYLVALDDGEVPLTFQFSGTVFHRDVAGVLQVAPVPWTAEAGFRLPVETWRQLMAEQYPDTLWLPLSPRLVERLHRHRVQTHGRSWDAVVAGLLDGAARPDGVDGARPGSVAGRAAERP